MSKFNRKYMFKFLKALRIFDAMPLEPGYLLMPGRRVSYPRKTSFGLHEHHKG